MSSLTLWIVTVSAAGAAVLFGVLALVLARPRRRVAEPEPVAEAAPEETHAAVPDVDRLRNIAAFSAVIDLDDLAARVLDAALAAAHTDAGAIAVRCQEPEPPLVAASGLTDAELDWLRASLLAHNESSVITRYLYEEAIWSDDRFVTATLVPLRDGDARPIGNLAALWRLDLGDEAERRVHALEAVAADASGAITNAVLYHDAAAASIRDTETGLLNRRYFEGRLEDEIERAQEFGASLTLLLVDVGEQRTGVQTLDAQLLDTASVVRGAFNGSVDVCRVGSTELATLVPRRPIEIRPTLERLRAQLTEENGGTLLNAVELEMRETPSAFLERARVSLAREPRPALARVKFTLP